MKTINVYLYLRSVFYVEKTPKTLIDKNEADGMPSTRFFFQLQSADSIDKQSQTLYCGKKRADEFCIYSRFAAFSQLIGFNIVSFFVFL